MNHAWTSIYLSCREERWYIYITEKVKTCYSAKTCKCKIAQQQQQCIWYILSMYVMQFWGFLVVLNCVLINLSYAIWETVNDFVYG